MASEFSDSARFARLVIGGRAKSRDEFCKVSACAVVRRLAETDAAISRSGFRLNMRLARKFVARPAEKSSPNYA